MVVVEAHNLSTSLPVISRSAARLRLRLQQVSWDMELHLRQHRPTSRAFTSSTFSRCSSCNSSIRDSSSRCCTTTTMLTLLTPASMLLRVRRLLHSGPDLRRDFRRLRHTLTQILLKTEALLYLNPRLHLSLRPNTPPQHQHTPLTPPTAIHSPPLPPPRVQ